MSLWYVLLGTGKSYTIEGGDQDDTKGVIPRASEEIFTCILDNILTWNSNPMITVRSLIRPL